MFNVTKVNKELRSSNFLSWFRVANFDYITNGYFVIKTDLKKEENRKILGLLVEKFGAIPQVGKGLQLNYTSKDLTLTDVHRKPEWMKIITERKTEPIEDTRLVLFDNIGKIRIFKGKDCIYINMNYFEMIKDPSFTKFEGSKPLEPITAISRDDLLLILPFRMPGDNGYLAKKKDLSSGN